MLKRIFLVAGVLGYFYLVGVDFSDTLFKVSVVLPCAIILFFHALTIVRKYAFSR